VLASSIPSFLQGTYIAIAQCADGILVAADKRLMSENGSYQDDDEKLVLIGRSGIGFVTGASICDVGEARFDAVALLRHAAASYSGDLQRFVEEFTATVCKELPLALQRMIINRKESGPLFCIGLVELKSTAVTMRLIFPEARSVAAPRPCAEVICKSTILGEYQAPAPLVTLGEELRLAEIFSPEPLLVELLARPELRPFQENGFSPLKCLDCATAAESVKFLIYLASKVQELRNPKRPSISPTSDCLLLRPNASPVWVYRNARPVLHGL
jgi:hypothetical protein